jgi:hypothetical protein
MSVGLDPVGDGVGSVGEVSAVASAALGGPDAPGAAVRDTRSACASVIRSALPMAAAYAVRWVRACSRLPRVAGSSASVPVASIVD